MEAAALQEIKTLVLAANGSRQVQDVDAIITQHGEGVVPLEPHRPGRARFRGKYSTSSIDSLAAYVKAFGAADVSGFVDADAMACVVYLNLGTKDTPGHGDHSATLTLRKTAFYAATLKIDGQQMSQQALAEWLEDWRGFIHVGNGSPLASAINAVRKIKIEAGRTATSEVGNLKATRTALEQIEASSDAGLPEELVGSCIPYDGLDYESIGLRLSVIASDAPKLVLRIVAKEALVEKLAEQFATKVRAALDGLAGVVVGKFTP